MNYYEHPFSWEALLRIVVVCLLIIFVWKTFNILILVLVSAMIAAALHPLVTKLSRRLPFTVATLLVILLLFVPFIFIGATVIPRLVQEFPSLIKMLDTILTGSSFLPRSLRSIDFSQYAKDTGSYVLQSTTIATGIVTSVITLIFLSFYFIIDSRRLVALFLSIFPHDKQIRIKGLLKELALVNGQYIRGNVTISVICGVILYIGLLLLSIPFAAPLAIFAAIMDLLPLVGSSIGMIPALLIAYSISPLTALFVLILYVVYQQFEGMILAPTIYNKALNLSPALSFLAVITGSALFGLVGAFLSLPFAASLPAIIKYMNEETNGIADIRATKKQRGNY